MLGHPGKTIAEAWERYIEFHTRAPFKYRSIALIGLLAFPFYYAVWTYVFPQPFENFDLRLIGMALCLGILVRRWWPSSWQKFYFAYSYVALMLCLPAFFTFMLLMNDATPVWLMSTMAAFLFVVLLYDVINAVIVSAAGSLLGIVGFFFVDGIQPLPIAYVASVPIYLFAVLAIVFLSYTENRIGREKLGAAKVLAANLAHEMRTPLIGIRMDCARLREDVEEFIAAAAPGDFAPTRRALARIDEHANAANQVIEMLLQNVTAERVRTEGFALHSLHSVVEKALDRFHFRAGERRLVTVDIPPGLVFWGSDLLLAHVLFNMIKNALNAIDAKGSGRISIQAEAQNGMARLTFADTGSGIPPHLLPLIFMPFVTGGARMQGTGIGLSFCRAAVESFGGQIRCASSPDNGTSFTMMLPDEPGGAPPSVRPPMA